MTLDGKIVLITGASEGIGVACARAFARRGAKLSLTALEPGESLQLDVDPLVTYGDITQVEVREQVVQRTIDAYGRIDVLINNAGVGLYASASQTPLPLVRRMFDVNVFASLGMSQLVAPWMVKQNHGAIVNIGSIGGLVTLPWAAMYCASKCALHAVSEGLRRELRRNGVRVITVVPGIVDTRFRDHVLTGRVPDRVARLRNVVQPGNLADAIANKIERNGSTLFKPWLGYLFASIDVLLPIAMDRYLDRQWHGEVSLNTAVVHGSAWPTPPQD